MPFFKSTLKQIQPKEDIIILVPSHSTSTVGFASPQRRFYRRKDALLIFIFDKYCQGTGFGGSHSFSLMRSLEVPPQAVTPQRELACGCEPTPQLCRAAGCPGPARQLPAPSSASARAASTSPRASTMAARLPPSTYGPRRAARQPGRGTGSLGDGRVGLALGTGTLVVFGVF